MNTIIETISQTVSALAKNPNETLQRISGLNRLDNLDRKTLGVKACGQTSTGLSIEDHVTVWNTSQFETSPNGKFVLDPTARPYNPKTDGEITLWFDEGDEVPGVVKPELIAIHDHNVTTAATGSVEYKTYKRSEYQKKA